MANYLLTTVCLASQAKIAIVPAMNYMYQAHITQQNIARLKERKFLVLGPDEGSQACGNFGSGRILDPFVITELALNSFKSKLDMLNLQLAITTGPTQEHIDLVCFFINHSSGKMGFAIAQAAAERLAQVPALPCLPCNWATRC